ncbi:uncharacterized protein LOC100368128 [Saccoglossus kowalevskii]
MNSSWILDELSLLEDFPARPRVEVRPTYDQFYADPPMSNDRLSDIGLGCKVNLPQSSPPVSPVYTTLRSASSTGTINMQERYTESGTGLYDEWKSMSPYLWTQEHVLSWLRQCMYEIDDYSDIQMQDFNLTGQQLMQMTKDDFMQNATKNGAILYEKLLFQRSLHNEACYINEPSIFSEDNSFTNDMAPMPFDDDVLPMEDIKNAIFPTEHEPCQEFLNFINELGAESAPTNAYDDVPVVSPSASSSQYTESEPSEPPSPDQPMDIFTRIESGFARTREDSLGEDSYESDSSSDNHSVFSTESLPVDVNVPPKRRHVGGKNLKLIKRPARRPGRPRKQKTFSSDDDDEFAYSRKTEGMKGNHLWEFIRDLLKNSQFNPEYIRWEDDKTGMFKIVQSERIAFAWGRKKNNPRMTYEKLSRAMRYYYKRDILERVDGRRLVYKFGKNAYGWKN